MRILQVNNKVPYPAKDGGAIACMNLVKGFSHLGHDVTVLSMNTAKHHVLLDEIPGEIANLADFRMVEVPAPINAFNAFLNLCFSSKPYNAVRFINKDFRAALKDLLEEKEFDVVQLEGLYVCPYIPFIRKKTKALVVYRAHNVEFEIWERTAMLAKGLKRLYLKNLSKRIKKLETAILNEYDVLVPITKRDERILYELGNIRPTHVSQTGIDSSALIPNIKNMEYPSVFHIGSMEWAPNQEALLWFLESCWPKIHEKYPKMNFYAAGRNAPNWLIQKLDQPNVVFKGEVDDAYDFMNSKAIMVVPLFSGSGMRIKIIEGLALGKGIVSTSIGAEGIEIENGKHLLIANTSDEFIQAISELVENRNLHDELGRNAIDFIHENFDNLAAAGKLVDFYKTFL